jgi:hypothetical protein
MYIRLQFLNIFRCKWTEEDIDIGFTPGDSSTPEKESGKHVLTPSKVDIEPNSKRLYTTPYCCIN